jgi:nuclear transport factor 2 (NTF2) superfamily protein
MSLPHGDGDEQPKYTRLVSRKVERYITTKITVTTYDESHKAYQGATWDQVGTVKEIVVLVENRIVARFAPDERDDADRCVKAIRSALGIVSGKQVRVGALDEP